MARRSSPSPLGATRPRPSTSPARPRKAPIEREAADTRLWDYAGGHLGFHGYRRQREPLAAPGYTFRPPPSSLPPPRSEPCGALPPALARRLERAAEEMRDLHEAGEIEWADLNPRSVWEWAFA